MEPHGVRSQTAHSLELYAQVLLVVVTERERNVLMGNISAAKSLLPGDVFQNVCYVDHQGHFTYYVARLGVYNCVIAE